MNPIMEEEEEKNSETDNIPKINSSYSFEKKPLLRSDVSSGDSIIPYTLNSNASKSPIRTRMDVLRQMITPRIIKKRLPLEIARLSLTIFFTGNFLILQPYHHSFANSLANPCDGIKLMAGVFIVALILTSFYALLQVIKKSGQRNSLSEPKKNKTLSIIALSLIIMSQSLLLIRIFMAYLVQYLVPLFFALSCIFWAIDSGLNQKYCLTKIIFSGFFALGALGAILLFLNVPGILFSTNPPYFWKNHLIPIMLIISLSCSVITALEPSYMQYDKMRTESMSSLSYNTEPLNQETLRSPFNSDKGN